MNVEKVKEEWPPVIHEYVRSGMIQPLGQHTRPNGVVAYGFILIYNAPSYKSPIGSVSVVNDVDRWDAVVLYIKDYVIKGRLHEINRVFEAGRQAYVGNLLTTEEEDTIRKLEIDCFACGEMGYHYKSHGEPLPDPGGVIKELVDTYGWWRTRSGAVLCPNCKPKGGIR